MATGTSTIAYLNPGNLVWAAKNLHFISGANKVNNWAYGGWFIWLISQSVRRMKLQK